MYKILYAPAGASQGALGDRRCQQRTPKLESCIPGGPRVGSPSWTRFELWSRTATGYPGHWPEVAHPSPPGGNSKCSCLGERAPIGLVISLIRYRPELAQAEMRGVAEHHGATDRPSDEEPDMIPSATHGLRRWCRARSGSDHNSTDRCKMHLQHIEICGQISSEFLGHLKFRRDLSLPVVMSPRRDVGRYRPPF